MYNMSLSFPIIKSVRICLSDKEKYICILFATTCL